MAAEAEEVPLCGLHHLKFHTMNKREKRSFLGTKQHAIYDASVCEFPEAPPASSNRAPIPPALKGPSVQRPELRSPGRAPSARPRARARGRAPPTHTRCAPSEGRTRRRARRAAGRPHRAERAGRTGRGVGGRGRPTGRRTRTGRASDRGRVAKRARLEETRREDIPTRTTSPSKSHRTSSVSVSDPTSVRRMSSRSSWSSAHCSLPMLPAANGASRPKRTPPNPAPSSSTARERRSHALRRPVAPPAAALRAAAWMPMIKWSSCAATVRWSSSCRRQRPSSNSPEPRSSKRRPLAAPVHGFGCTPNPVILVLSAACVRPRALWQQSLRRSGGAEIGVAH